MSIITSSLSKKKKQQIVALCRRYKKNMNKEIE